MARAAARAVRNFGFLAVSQLLTSAVHFAVLAGIARVSGKAALGAYATAVAVALYFILVPDLGLGARLVREAASRPDHAQDEYSAGLSLKLMLLIPALLLILLLSKVLPYDEIVIRLFVLIGIASVIQSFCRYNESLLRAREKMQWEAGLGLMQGVIVAVAGIAGLAAGFGLVWIGWCRIAAVGARFAIGAFATAREVQIVPSWPPQIGQLKAAVPYAATSIAALTFAQVDIMIISMIASPELVGEYTAISRLLVVSGSFAVMGANTLLPAAARSHTRELEPFAAAMAGTVRVTAIAAALATLGLACLGRPLLPVLFGEEFKSLGVLFVLGTPFVYLKTLTSIFGMGLTASGRQGSRARAMLVGLTATVVLVLTLVPPLGLSGAVAALVLSEATLAGATLMAGWSFLRRPETLRAVANTLVPLVIAGVLWSVLGGWEPPWREALPLAVAVALIAGTGELFRAWDWARTVLDSRGPPAG